MWKDLPFQFKTKLSDSSFIFYTLRIYSSRHSTAHMFIVQVRYSVTHNLQFNYTSIIQVIIILFFRCVCASLRIHSVTHSLNRNAEKSKMFRWHNLFSLLSLRARFRLRNSKAKQLARFFRWPPLLSRTCRESQQPNLSSRQSSQRRSSSRYKTYFNSETYQVHPFDVL